MPYADCENTRRRLTIEAAITLYQGGCQPGIGGRSEITAGRLA